MLTSIVFEVRHPKYTNYGICTNGQVFSYMRRKVRELKPSFNQDGYYEVTIRDENGKQKTVEVHQLVIQTFIGYPPIKEECRHIDNVKTNNDISNLYYGTRLQNSNDRKDILSKEDVLSIVWLYRIRKSYKITMDIIGKIFNTHPVHISLIVNGGSRNHITGIRKRGETK